MAVAKKSAADFVFDRIIGEGSFSVVYLARDIQSNTDVAVKVCEKRHIYREGMQKAVLREKHLMHSLNEANSPFFIKLYCTFQDDTRLFFVTNYCINGELLSFINQREIFNEQAALFYAAEILLALEHLHKLDIIHRDLKPENILLNDKMHIQITDFGSALSLKDPNNEIKSQGRRSYRNRKSSFVGTAQYVSPEMLTNRKITPMCDMWAFSCILFQMITSKPPFTSGNEYLIFQKIQNLEYTFPDDFPENARHLVQSILKINSDERLGAQDDVKTEGYISLRNHAYFRPLNGDWDLINQKPPEPLLAVAKSEINAELTNSENLEPGLSEKQIARLLGLALHDTEIETTNANHTSPSILDIPPQEFEERLQKQRETNQYHRFVENNLILKQGLLDKKKGFFPRRRMFLLTTGPHLYYVDPATMVLKGQIPFSKELRTEAKNFRNFYVHVPNRTYILEDTSNTAPAWCEAIEDVMKHTFKQDSPNSSSQSRSSFSPPLATSPTTAPNAANVNNGKLPRKSSSKSSFFNLHLRKISLVEKTN